MTFAMSRDSYDRYLGRYSDELASAFVAFVGMSSGMRALDVGCGPGALTEALANRLGASRGAAADPSESLLAACAERVSGADVRLAAAGGLPWPDADAAHILGCSPRTRRSGTGRGSGHALLQRG